MPKQVTSDCNGCRQKTQHRVVRSYERSIQDGRCVTHTDPRSDPHEPAPLDYHEVCEQFDVVECCGCGDVHFIQRKTWDAGIEADPDEHECPPEPVDRFVQETHYPARIDRPMPGWLSAVEERSQWSPLQELPEYATNVDYVAPGAMFDLLGEVYRALYADSPRLAVMGVRAIVDVVCAHKIGDCGGFSQKLDALVKGEFVSSRDRDILKSTIELGHAVIHRGHAPSISDVSAALDIVENMIQTMYHLQVLAEKLRSRTPPRPEKGDGAAGSNP